MKKINKLSKEELIALCRSEKVTDETIFLFHECAFDSVPSASSYVGEWIWSNDIIKIYECFNECILWNFIAEMNHYDESISEKMKLLDLVKTVKKINDSRFNFELKKILAFRKKINYMIEANEAYEEIKNKIFLYIKTITRIFQDYDLECDTFICDNFDDVISQVEIHNEGIIPVFETKEEYLLEDGYC